MTPFTPNPSVLVVIPTLNEAANISQVLGAILGGLPSQLRATVVVADGGSTDGTPALVEACAARDPRVRLLHNPRRLQSAAVNLAVREMGANADVLVRCDAHAKYPERYVSRLLESMANNAADAVVVPMDSLGDTCLRRAIAWVSDSKIGSGGSAHRGGRQSGFVDHGHHAAFRMASFKRAGGYDETFTHNEDAELDCRQRAMGSRIYLDSDIRLGYYPRATLVSLWRQYFDYGRGRSRTLRRHPGSLRMRQLAVPGHVALSSLAVLVSPWFGWLMVWPLLYLAVLVGAGVGQAAKRHSLCGLLCSPAAFAMHTAWALGFFDGWLTLHEARWTPGPLNGNNLANRAQDNRTGGTL